jgi:hypothetical protein
MTFLLNIYNIVLLTYIQRISGWKDAGHSDDVRKDCPVRRALAFPLVAEKSIHVWGVPKQGGAV